MKKISQILYTLYSNIQNDYLKRDILKLSKSLKYRSKHRKFLILNKAEIESLVNSKGVEYEDFIGDISINNV